MWGCGVCLGAAPPYPQHSQFWERERRGSGCYLAQQRTKPQGETEVREDGGLAQDHPGSAGWGLGGRGGCRPRGLDGGADPRGLGQGGLQNPKAEPRGGNPTGSAGTSRRGVRLDARAHLSEGAAWGAGGDGGHCGTQLGSHQAQAEGSERAQSGTWRGGRGLRAWAPSPAPGDGEAGGPV